MYPAIILLLNIFFYASPDMNSAQQLYIRFFCTTSLLVKILTFFCTKLLQLPKSNYQRGSSTSTTNLSATKEHHPTKKSLFKSKGGVLRLSQTHSNKPKITDLFEEINIRAKNEGNQPMIENINNLLQN
jgi:hypothetical protein